MLTLSSHALCAVAAGNSETLEFRHEDGLESRLALSGVIAIILFAAAGAAFIYARRSETVDGMSKSRPFRVVGLRRIHSKLHIVSVECNGTTQVVFADNGHTLLELGRFDVEPKSTAEIES